MEIVKLLFAHFLSPLSRQCGLLKKILMHPHPIWDGWHTQDLCKWLESMATTICSPLEPPVSKATYYWFVIVKDASTSVQIGHADVNLWIWLFGKSQSCTLITFMSLECSDTERWSHWQRPAFARRVAVVWAAESEHQGFVCGDA